MSKTVKRLILVVLVIAAMLGIYLALRPKPAKGEKEVVVEVVNSEGNTKTYEADTDAEVLIDLMNELKDDGFSYDGEDGEYGYFITEINGEQAIYAEDNAYWAIYVNDEYGMYGVSEQPVTNGDTYKFVYEKAQ
ncbi:MAG: DUF4430 domain-containing protein [Solobacterium sp.]|nr:DUF4430 domain-containing protein [Solobacterium sp.]